MAERQEGLVTRAQLFDAGCTRALVDNALKRGRLVPMHRGVYGVGHRAQSPHAPAMAALLAVGDGAVLSHESAAHLWDLIPWREPPARRHVTVAGRDPGHRRDGIEIHRVVRWHDGETAVRGRLPVTAPARTLLDIAPLGLGEREYERAFDRALKSRVMTRREAAATATAAAFHPGSRRLGAVARAELASPGESRSQLEERLLELIRAGGLPEPELNARIGRHTVDALWRSFRLIVEIDSYGYHGTRFSFESDHQRDLQLGGAGFTVMRFTADQLLREPAFVLVQLAQRLTSLGARLVS